MYEGSITDVAGLLVGHAQDAQAMTGLSVVLMRGRGGICGVDVRGSAPGTRETDFMAQAKTVEYANAILLTGGSAFGLNAVEGVMNYCEQNRMGLLTREACIPIVPAAVIYDLDYGVPTVRPNPVMAYAACMNAGVEVYQGSVGVGIGATVGKALGPQHCEKGGVGTASIRLMDGVVVSAMVCVNAFGDVVELDGTILAGAHSDGAYIDTQTYLMTRFVEAGVSKYTNTSIGVVATDAKLTKDGATKLAQCAHDGLARAITPIHTEFDGDTMFGVSFGEQQGDLNAICIAGAEVTRRAVINAIHAVKPAVREEPGE